jgi:hypothetical protein
MVLKPNFRQIAVEGEGGIPTQGGRFQSQIEPSFLMIGENGRLNVNAGWEHKTMLLESERDLVYDDPAQAAEAPARSLLSASDQYLIDATIQRSLNKVTDASVNVRFDQTDSLSLLGPGVGGVSDPLERDSRSRNLATTASVNGMLGNWRWSVSGNYADADQLTFTDRISGARDRFDSSQQTFGGQRQPVGHGDRRLGRPDPPVDDGQLFGAAFRQPVPKTATASPTPTLPATSRGFSAR